jgi:hypothetical protein
MSRVARNLKFHSAACTHSHILKVETRASTPYCNSSHRNVGNNATTQHSQIRTTYTTIKMADELTIALMAEENEIQGSGVAECLIDVARTTVQCGTARVDNPSSISQELAVSQLSKAFTLRTLFGISGSCVTKPSQGQVGFLRGDPIAPSPSGQMQYAVTPVTVKHNLRQIKHAVRGISQTFNALSTEMYLPWDTEVRVHLFLSEFELDSDTQRPFDSSRSRIR